MTDCFHLGLGPCFDIVTSSPCILISVRLERPFFVPRDDPFFSLLSHIQRAICICRLFLIPLDIVLYTNLYD